MAKKDTSKAHAQKTIKELFELLGIEAKTKVVLSKDAEQTIVDVAIASSPEAGLLIGSHGATLHALESFIAMAIKQETGEWVRVSLDVDGWKDKQDQYLKDLAVQAANRARTTGEPQNLYNLNPSQRRTIHMHLGQESGIHTESHGEGEGRYLIVKPE